MDKILDINERFAEMLGYERDELVGQNLISFIAPDDRPRVLHNYQANLDSYDIECAMQRKDGSHIIIAGNGQTIEQNGMPLRLTAIRDITKHKQTEHQLLQLNEDLECRIEQRTSEIQTAREEAERANAAKSEFLSRMSHELRTPLNAILGFGQLLESDHDHPLTAVQSENIKYIMHSGQHLLALVNEVLDLSRIESGRLEVSLEKVAVQQLIASCVAQLRPLAEQRGIKVVLDTSPPYSVKADHTRMKQVLLNLLSNAIKFNREGGDILVSCTRSNGQGLRISVRDTGPGIPAESLPRLFRPFERLESAYQGIAGTGIGLALARKLIEAMHGKIDVESSPGAGSTFWFELPLSEAPEQESVAAPRATTLDIAAGNSPRQYKLLYVEDNPANLRLVQKILSKRQDIKCFDAINGENGLAIALREQPDLILLDINLPDMGGYEVLRRLKEHAATRDIPVIAVTANTMTRDIERAMQAGFAGHIAKPLNVMHFLLTINNALAL